MTMYGDDSVKKADYLSESIFKASRNTLQKVGLEDFTETSIELMGLRVSMANSHAINPLERLPLKLRLSIGMRRNWNI